MTAKILMQARKQQSELQDEYGIGVDDQDEQHNNNNNKSKTKFLNNKNDDLELSGGTSAASGSAASGFNFRPFKKLQTSRLQQQQIRKSDHDDSDSDSDTDEHLEDCENKRDFYSDEEIVNILSNILFLDFYFRFNSTFFSSKLMKKIKKHLICSCQINQRHVVL